MKKIILALGWSSCVIGFIILAKNLTNPWYLKFLFGLIFFLIGGLVIWRVGTLIIIEKIKRKEKK